MFKLELSFALGPVSEDSRLADPLDILPNDYDQDNYDRDNYDDLGDYDDYDPNDVPADQAEDLSGYGAEELSGYGGPVTETTTEPIQGPNHATENCWNIFLLLKLCVKKM